MKKFRAAVVGYGNIGKFTVEALEAAPDFEIAGIVRRQGAKDKPAELANYEVVDDITKLKDVDVAILATPTRSCPEYAEKIVALGINTVDSFDIHTSILNPASHNLDIIVRIIIHNPCHRRLLHRLLLFLAKPIFGLKFLLHLYNKLGLI